jgi:hypothetical protein
MASNMGDTSQLATTYPPRLEEFMNVFADLVSPKPIIPLISNFNIKPYGLSDLTDLKATQKKARKLSVFWNRFASNGSLPVKAA